MLASLEAKLVLAYICKYCQCAPMRIEKYWHMAIPKRYTYIFVVAAGTEDKFEIIVEHLPPKAITRPPSAVYNIIVIEIKWN